MGAALRRVLVRSWTRRGALACLLWPVSIVYGWLLGARGRLYRLGILSVHRLPVPVIVVGNVVAGGGGKTPLVLAIVRHLQHQGYRVGVVSRGYGRAGSDCREVLPHSSAEEVGDEPLLIGRLTGADVFVAPRRIDAAQALLRRHPGVHVLVSDDGLQHHQLHRDLELCVFDRHGSGNGLLLPAGPLREPWPRPVDLVLADDRAQVAHAWPVRRTLASHALRSDGSRVSLSDLGAPGTLPDGGLWAVAGIAHPQDFFDMLRDAGVPLERTIALPDHASFDDLRWPSGRAHLLLCTEKDAVKLWRHMPQALAVPLEIGLTQDFWTRFDDVFRTRAGPKLSSAHGYTSA